MPGTAVPKTCAANERAGELAGAHLIQAGHRRLAFIGGLVGMLSTIGRLAGFRRAIAAIPGIAIVQELGCDYFVAEEQRLTDAIPAATPAATAVFVTSDVVARGVLERLREREVVMPEDLPLLTFDDFGPLHLFAPALTAVHKAAADMGTWAGALLMSHIAGAAQAGAPVGRADGARLRGRAAHEFPALAKP